MHRFLFFLLLLVSAGLGLPTARAQSSAEGLPARPSPFRFVTDEANLLSEANAKTLENGLRRYADDNGTQIVLVTVPSLGGRSVADYARALGEAWGVGQRDKNNGIVVLLSGQERQVSVQAGSGLRDKITPDVVSRVINEKMTPSFKQGNYFAGLRAGLNTLMATANPSSKPAANDQTPVAAATGASSAVSNADLNNDLASTSTAQESAPYSPAATPEPTSSGPGIGTLLLGALVIGGGIWLVIRMFRRRSDANAQAGNTPNFYPNNPGGAGGNYNRGPAGPQGNGPAPNFYPNQSGVGGMGNMGGGGSGIGGILATGAAAAAGAYLGNRMAGGGHNDQGSNLSEAGLGGAHNSNLDPPTNYSGTPSGEFPALGGAAGAGNDYSSAEPDYFSGGDTDNSGDYFSDDSAYNDTSSDDVGGGGFDDDSDNSGSW